MRGLILLLIAAVAALAVIVPWLEPRLVFFPTPGESGAPGGRPPTKRLEIRTADGERLAAWWFAHPRARADIIYFHGNGGNLSLWGDVLASLQQRGFNVLGFDYRGYGLSSGAPSEQGLRRDTDAVLAAHADLAAERRPLIYWGRSLGGVFAAYATTVRPPAGLVLESAFPDKRAVLRHNPLFRLLNVFSRYKLSTIESLREWLGPTLVLHGDRDSVIPFALGEEVFASLRGDKRFVRLGGADHNDVFGPEAREYWTAVDSFLATVTGDRQH